MLVFRDGKLSGEKASIQTGLKILVQGAAFPSRNEAGIFGQHKKTIEPVVVRSNGSKIGEHAYIGSGKTFISRPL